MTRKLISLILSTTFVLNLVSISATSINAAEIDDSKQTGDNYQNRFITALINNQNKWNPSKYDCFYFCDIDWDGNFELICDYPADSSGRVLAEAYGFDDSNIYQFTIGNTTGTDKTRFQDTKGLYFDVKEQRFVWDCTNVKYAYNFCYNVNSSHYSQYNHYMNYELVAYNKKLYRDYYSGYCSKDGYLILYRKGSPVDGFTPGVYGYNISGRQSYSVFNSRNSDRRQYYRGQDAYYAKIYYNYWSTQTTDKKTQLLRNSYNAFINQNKLRIDNVLNAPKLKSAVSTSNGIKITWGKVQYAEKYRVFYKGSNGSWKRLGDTVNTSFVDDDVKSGSTYTYTVRPINSAGDVYTGSFDSKGISATYNPPMLATPQITGFESTSDGVKIKWNRVSNAYGYRVFYKGRNGWKGMGNTTETFFVDTDVSDEVTYTYTVRCIDKSGNFVSDYNNNGWNYTYLMPQLSTPQITKFESTAEGVKITWNKVSGAYGYRVFYLGRDGWKGMGNTTGNTFVDNDVRDGGTYTYTVRCIGQNGNFTSRYNTNGWKYTYVKPQLATPQITKFESTFDGVKITWNKVANAYGYRVFYLGRDGWKSMGNTTGNTFVDDDVRDGGTYTYTVRCINANGDFVSRYNTNGWKYTYRVPWLTTPQITSLKSTDNGVEIKWNKVSGTAQYRVFYKGANGSWKRLATTAATSFTDDDVRSGSTYTYTVRCVDASGEIYTSLYDNAGKSIKYVNAKADYIDKLMDTIDSWSFEDYRGMVAQSGFTFMDLDFDGVNEFIVQREGGTMRNFDAVVYTYKNGKVVKVPANEEFIQNNNFQYFYNTSTKKYLIVGTAVCAEGTVNNRKIYNYSLTYANNRITSDYYSACFVNVAWRSPSGKDEYHYYNGADGYYKGIGNHKEITEVQYNTINSNKLKNCVDCNMKRKFVIQYEWNPLSKAEKRRQMLDAYNAFTYTKH